LPRGVPCQIRQQGLGVPEESLCVTMLELARFGSAKPLNLQVRAVPAGVAKRVQNCEHRATRRRRPAIMDCSRTYFRPSMRIACSSISILSRIDASCVLGKGISPVVSRSRINCPNRASVLGAGVRGHLVSHRLRLLRFCSCPFGRKSDPLPRKTPQAHLPHRRPKCRR
jgi:hypothetical protein